jgi:serine/threonine protein kinase
VELRLPCDYGGYRLTGILGTGGSATVYRAESRDADGTVHDVAIRRIASVASRDTEGQQAILKEAKMWLALRHPNVVSVLDVGETGGDWFQVLELVDGPSLDDLLRAMDPLPVNEALCIAQRIALGLAEAHGMTNSGKPRDVVHRDVKPGNILISSDGVAKLTDFGIARTNERLGRTAAGIVKGSLHFLSPEQVRKDDLDARTDLFLLGCTLHTTLTCRPLIDLPKNDALRALARGDIPVPPEWLPAKVRALLAMLTAANPKDRPRDATAVADRIRALMAPESPEEVEALLAARVALFRQRP